MRFDGETYEPKKDKPRLTKQYLRVFNLMKDARWRTLRGISAGVDAPEASVSARLRDMRKKRFGSHKVERERGEGGTHTYRLIVNRGQLEFDLDIKERVWNAQSTRELSYWTQNDTRQHLLAQQTR